jgi:hypothetical protein
MWSTVIFAGWAASGGGSAEIADGTVWAKAAALAKARNNAEKVRAIGPPRFSVVVKKQDAAAKVCDKYSMSDIANLTHAAEQGDREKVRAILDGSPELVDQLDESGAAALHYAALHGHREVVRLLIERGAQINRADNRFGATPAGWAIEYLREMGGYLGNELDDLAYAIENGDIRWVARFLKRFPGLRHANSTNGRPFRQLAAESGNGEIASLFGTADAG